MKLKEARWLMAFVLWFFASMAIGVLIIRHFFPDAPFSVGPEAAPVAMPALYFSVLIGLGIFALGFLLCIGGK